MVRIPDFQERWTFYEPRARIISPYFRTINEDAEIGQEAICSLIPFGAKRPLPARVDPDAPRRLARKTVNGRHIEPKSPTDPISQQAVGGWFKTEILPDDRKPQWQDLTRISIDDWAGDHARFERAVRTAAGEVLGWQGLVQEHGQRGQMVLRISDPDPQHRFFLEGDEPADPPDLQLVWPGCIARIEVEVVLRSCPVRWRTIASPF